MAKHPVTRQDIANLSEGFHGGIKRPAVTTAAYDPIKARIAKKAVSAGGFGMGRQRSAGMMIDFVQNSQPYMSGFRLDAYRNSYANGLDQRSGTYDVPVYFQQMNEQNGGLLYWPVTLQEKYQWYRYWARCFTRPDVLITKPDGTEAPLYSFAAGDEVINAKGAVTRIRQVTQQAYEGEVISFSVEGNHHNELEVTPEHPFLVVRKEKILRHHNRVKDEDGEEHRKTNVEIDYSPEWISAEDIREGDCLVVPKTNVGAELEISVEKARLVGYYLAEGNINFDRAGKPEAITWSLGTHEDGLIEEICSLCQELVGDVPSAYNYEDRQSVTTLRLWNKELAEWVYLHCGTGSRKKKLSKELFNCQDVEAVRHLLACWLNGDGTREHEESDAAGRVSGTTTSDSMSHQLYLMAVRAGMCVAKNPGSSCEYGGGKEIGSAWRLRVAGHSSNILSEYTKWPSFDTHNRYRKFNHEGNLLLPVRKINKRVHVGHIWNFETEGDEYEDRTFLVYGMATHNTDAYIGRSLELLSDLPMSKLTLSMPKHVPKEMQSEIMDFFEAQLELLNAFQLLLDILWETNMIGNVYIFHEWDEKLKRWSRAVVLPPEEVYIFEYPFSQNARVEYRPERMLSIIKDAYAGTDSLPDGTDIGTPGTGECMRGDLTQKILEHIPEDLIKMVQEQGCIVMDTDPTTGSFVHHIARRKSPYLDLGASALERVLIPMLQKEHYRYTQLSLASRNMTPKNLITAEGLMPEELDDLRTQVDLSYMDPEYTIITNYAVTWEQIGAQDRLIDLSREYETIENQVFAALGVTRELLTGEGAFSGNKITVEILNTMFLLSREVLKDYLEKQLFKPIAEAHGWYTEDKNGVKKYWYPHVGFNRLTIRDNAEVFDSLFQLYQKNSLPVEVIYELFNLDADRMAEKLKEDLFTVNDATFNRTVEEVNSEVGRALVEQTDIVKRQAEYLGFEFKEAPPEGEEGGFGGEFGDEFGGGFEEGGGESEGPPESETVEGEGGESGGGNGSANDLVDTMVEHLPAGASDEEIRDILDKVTAET